jgi:hypothetical protein
MVIEEKFGKPQEKIIWKQKQNAQCVVSTLKKMIVMTPLFMTILPFDMS